MSFVNERHPRDRDPEDIGPSVAELMVEDGADQEPEVSGQDLMRICRAAVTNAEHGDQAAKRAEWARAYRAYRNKHFEGSKYHNPRYGTRSKLFVPKTRAAVRKNMASAAAALFATDDVVNVTPENDADEVSRAAAAFQDAVLNYRLDRTSGLSGIPWFAISMGANMDAQITGVCLSKQYWEWEEIEEHWEEPEEADPNVVDFRTGEPKEMPKRRILRDRPMIDLIPPDMAILDTAARWHSVVQEGRYFIAQYPMTVAEVRDMMRPGRQYMGGGGWKQIDEQIIASAVERPKSEATNLARQDGADRHSSQNRPKAGDLDVVWVHENFVRYEGRDWHFWSLGTKTFLTDPRETIEVYPALKGQRPYVMGLGAIETHNPCPMSMVTGVQPLQMEINDLRNLRLDTVKQAVSPIVKVRAGANVDYKALHNRGPESTITMRNPESDVIFERPPDASMGAFTEGNFLNADFDEISGSFSTSSVTTNRSLNETVGGMKMLQGAAGGVTEFDLRVWIETWVEPVLRHIVMLEQHYESDERVMALAGRKAEILEQFGLDPQAEDLMAAEVHVRVNAGIGASDPMMRMQKLQQALQMGMGISQAFGEEVKVKAKEVLEEIFGLAGYRDAERFVEIGGEKQPPPEAQKMQMEQQKLQAEMQLKQKELELKERELALKEQELAARMRLDQQEQQQEGAIAQGKLALERQKMQAGMMQNMARIQADGERKQVEANEKRNTDRQKRREKGGDLEERLNRLEDLILMMVPQQQVA